MSTDIDGISPKSPAGNFFNPGSRWLGPLADFLQHLERRRWDELDADSIYEDYDIWYANHGDDLDEQGCLQLAAVVRQALNHGEATRWAMENGHPWRLNEHGNAVYHIGSPCALFSEQCVRHFAEFLENCGGFTVS